MNFHGYCDYFDGVRIELCGNMCGTEEFLYEQEELTEEEEEDKR